MIIGIDHGYYAMKTPHICFPTGLSRYDYEPYTMQNVLQYAGNYYVCGTGRQTLMKDKTANDNYYLLTMAALAQEIEYRRAERKGKIILAAGLPLAGFGREKTAFRQYLFRKEQPLCFRYENESYELTIEDVKLFPQGYSALALHPEYVRDEPSVLLVDIGGWTVDLMRLDNAVPNAAACRSLELGVIRCIDETMEQVRRSTGLSVTDIQIERVLNGNSCSLDPRHLFRFYTDAEIKRLNEHIFKMDEQICRALIIHQLLGTRISDTLTLKPDCLSMREGRYFIRIDQVKSITYEKAISEEVARLIMKAIDYTKERYGETTYIFVKKDEPTKPYQYSMIQNQIMKMIRQEDIRDDNGELLRFGTHIFRHCYGKKLTEMHVDDWMIAKLLGHTTTLSVHYYRKIGNKLMADETRGAREKMDRILLDIIEGWDDYEI